MKILMLTPYLPYPLWSGGQIRTFNLLKNLSKKHEITLFSFIRSEKEKEYIPVLKKYCNEVKVFYKRPPWSLTSLFLAASSYYPLVVCLYLSSQVRRELEEVIRRKHFDLIHAETFYVMPNIPQINIPVILAEQTIEYLVYRHYLDNVNFFLKKALMNWDVAKIHFWEKRFWNKAKLVIAMSPSDKKLMKSRISNLQVDIVPNGVDTAFFNFRRRQLKNKVKTVLFVGNFKWLQNREAVIYLLDKVWPEIIKVMKKEVRLWIVGKSPPAEILNNSAPQVLVSDNIDDIRFAYRKSDVLLAPIFGPGGTRYKILESMAAGVPVVTTSTGIEGLAARKFREVLIADNSRDLAELTVKVLLNPRLYKKLAKNGRKLVENKFSWKVIAQKLDGIYQKAT